MKASSSPNNGGPYTRRQFFRQPCNAGDVESQGLPKPRTVVFPKSILKAASAQEVSRAPGDPLVLVASHRCPSRRCEEQQ